MRVASVLEVPRTVNSARRRETNAFAAFVRARLDELDRKNAWLIEVTGISSATLYRWLGDDPPQNVPLEQLHTLADALEVPRDELVGLWQTKVVVARGQDAVAAEIEAFILRHPDATEDAIRNAFLIADRAMRMSEGEEG